MNTIFDDSTVSNDWNILKSRVTGVFSSHADSKIPNWDVNSDVHDHIFTSSSHTPTGSASASMEQALAASNSQDIQGMIQKVVAAMQRNGCPLTTPTMAAFSNQGGASAGTIGSGVAYAHPIPLTAAEQSAISQGSNVMMAGMEPYGNLDNLNCQQLTAIYNKLVSNHAAATIAEVSGSRPTTGNMGRPDSMGAAQSIMKAGDQPPMQAATNTQKAVVTSSAAQTSRRKPNFVKWLFGER